MVYKYDLAPEPIPAEAMHMSPPCRVSTHRSRVVAPDGPPTFLEHREAVPGIPQITSLTTMRGHPDPVPIESSPPPISACSHRGEARCSLAPYRLGSHVGSLSGNGLRGCAPVICSCCWSSPHRMLSKRPPGFPAGIRPSFRNGCNLMLRWRRPRWSVSPQHQP